MCGCNTLPPIEAATVELVETPFFTQTRYHCGPNALATALHRTGVQLEPSAVADLVYIPARKGSLQIEMTSAIRRFDRLAVEIEPSIDAIIRELHLGHPVVVLQNLGVKWIPVWHYAVIVGYDAQSNRLVMRSGTERRRLVAPRKFLRTWDRAERWGIVVLNPGELPSDAEPDRYLDAVVALETLGQSAAAMQAYAAGAKRWPRDKLMLFGQANAAFASQTLVEAVAIYRRLLEIHPRFAPAANNLAHTLGRLGCRNEALTVLDSLGPVDAEVALTLAATRDEVLQVEQACAAP